MELLNEEFVFFLPEVLLTTLKTPILFDKPVRSEQDAHLCNLIKWTPDRVDEICGEQRKKQQ